MGGIHESKWALIFSGKSTSMFWKFVSYSKNLILINFIW